MREGELQPGYQSKQYFFGYYSGTKLLLDTRTLSTIETERLHLGSGIELY